VLLLLLPCRAAYDRLGVCADTMSQRLLAALPHNSSHLLHPEGSTDDPVAQTIATFKELFQDGHYDVRSCPLQVAGPKPS